MTVKNLDRSLSFYGAAFGLELLDRVRLDGPEFAAVVGIEGAAIERAMLAGANVVIELIEYVEAPGRSTGPRNNDVGAGHFCFIVEDIDEACERITALGGTFTCPPATAPDEHPMTGSRYAYFVDLDGLTVELLQPGPFLELDRYLHAE